jgi:hypothetical protein
MKYSGVEDKLSFGDNFPAISTTINTQVEQCNYTMLFTPKPTNLSAALFKDLLLSNTQINMKLH